MGTAFRVTAAADFTLQREMGCTREEFVRWLPGATRHAPMALHADRALVHAGPVTVEIAFTPAPPRKIALMVLPVLQVSFRFTGGDAGAYQEFLAYFDLYTKRGGG